MLHEGIQVGNVYEKAQISQELFGDSFKLKIGNMEGFLHKTHAVLNNEESEEEDVDTKKKKKEVELTKGMKLDKVRVKEINYFDGCPILSMRDDVVNTNAINYGSLECGAYVKAVVEEVNEQDKFITLRLNEFVKGRLYLEHMADFTIKTMPPKFTKIGKEIKVRVFNVDPKTRSLEFTKKDTLLKPKTPVY